jgi:hypothetical protein
MLAIIRCRIFCLPVLLSNNIKIKIHRIIILPVVLYGCETWSLTLREERTFRKFKYSVLRRILGPRRDEETGKWRTPHNEKLHDLCSSPNIIRVMKSRVNERTLITINSEIMRVEAVVARCKVLTRH